MIIAVLTFVAVGYGQAETARIAILPFQMNSDQDLGFLKNGIQDMLGSRLSWENKVKVIDKTIVNQAAGDVTNFTGKSRALLVGGKLQADYVVYGSLTLIGNSASIDAKVLDIAGENDAISFFNQAETIGEVIPKINQFATDINTTVFKRPKSGRIDPQTPQTVPGQYASPNQGFILPSQRMPYMTGPGQGGEYWRSPDFDDLIAGMAFGDVNKDGVNELVYITDHEVVIYQFFNGRFQKLGQAAEKSVNKLVAVDVADINRNGTPEIFVSSLTSEENEVSSFILEFDGSGYKEILSRSPYLFRVTQAEQGDAVLLGQKPVNNKGGIFGAPIYRMKNTGVEYVEDELLLKRKLGNVLGVALGKIEDGAESTTIAFDNKDYLRLFNGTGRPNWTSTEKLGGNIERYLVMPARPVDNPTPQYFPTRIRLFDTDQDGKTEVITSVNHDLTMNLVQGFRSFKKARMQALSLDSLGLQPIWESRNLSGRISDFFISDFDNDGIIEIVIALVKKDKGAFVNTGALSMIVAFDLMPVKK